jgi:hypothetical protein
LLLIKKEVSITTAPLRELCKERGLYYNSTIERIVYRKYDEIRKEVSKILSETNIINNQLTK